MSKKVKFLFLIIFLILLFTPTDRASAFIGTGIFDFFDSALSGIEELAGPIAQKVISIFLTYILGLIFLATSTSLLELTLDPNWLHLRGNDIVQAGWHFTAGLANMLIVLILIVIAFSFILKIENRDIKKALPRLLAVALLINFSLVFIGMLIDGANIISNTFLGGNRQLPSQIVEVIGGGGRDVVKNMGAWIGVLAGMFIIPFIAPFSQLALVTTMATSLIFLPNFLAWFFQIFAFFTVGLIFLAYAILFAARVFIIQALAIIAPLAFLALILPQTKKYWDKWLHALLEWTFFGIFLFFFMVLGLKLINQILPADISPTSPTPFLDLFKIQKYFVYYFFLCLYLIVVGLMSKKMMPAFAQAVIDQAAGFAKMAWGGALVPLGGAMKGRLDRLAMTQKKKEEDIKARRTAGEEVRLGMGQRLAMGAGKWARRGVELGHRAAGTTPSAAIAMDLNKKVAEYKKRYGEDFVSAAQLFPNLRDDFDQAALALHLQKTKGGKALGKLKDDATFLQAAGAVAKYSPAQLDDIIKYRPDLVDEENARKTAGESGARNAKLIQNTLVSDGLTKKIDPKTGKETYEDSDIQKMINAGVTIDGESIEKLIAGTVAEKVKVIREAAYKKAVDALKNEDIDTLTDATLDDVKFQEMTIRYKPLNFVRRIGEEKGSEYIEKLHKKFEKLGVEETMKTNEVLIRSTIINPGFKATFSPISGAETIEEVDVLGRLKAHPELKEYDRNLKYEKELREKINQAIKDNLTADAAKANAVLTQLKTKIASEKKNIEGNAELSRIQREIEELKRRQREQRRR